MESPSALPTGKRKKVVIALAFNHGSAGTSPDGANEYPHEKGLAFFLPNYSY
jgi:hypothetical protein